MAWRHSFGKLRRHPLIFAALTAWVLAVGAGFGILLRYANTPGRPAAPVERWPRGAPIVRAAAHRPYTLVLFAHSQCGCTSASLAELALIMTCCADQVESTVFFYVPSSYVSSSGAQAWSTSSLWREARRIPGVRLLPDIDGKVARLYGARTSGQTMIYDAAGQLAFAGGITSFRGHSGDNDGRDAIVALLRGQRPRRRATPVFGCALFEGG
jgi:hypothetical protein